MENNLQKIRWDKNWSQAKLAIRSGVPQSVISKIENDKGANPGVFTALKLARALSVDVDDIFIL